METKPLGTVGCKSVKWSSYLPLHHRLLHRRLHHHLGRTRNLEEATRALAVAKPLRGPLLIGKPPYQVLLGAIFLHQQETSSELRRQRLAQAKAVYSLETKYACFMDQMSAEARICEYWYCSNLACLVTRYGV